MHSRNTINSAVKISKALIASYHSTELAAWTLERLVNEMEQCEAGLQNLKTTYACDSMMVANLDVLSDRLRAHKSEVRRFITDASGTSAAADAALEAHIGCGHDAPAGRAAAAAAAHGDV